MPRSEVIEFLLRVRGGPQAQRDFDRTGKSIEKSGDAARRSQSGFRAGSRGIARMAAEAGALAAGAIAITSAVTATSDFAKSTLMVARATGMDTKQASLWAGMTKTRGIETKQLSTMFVRLNRSIVAGRKGTKSAAEAWNQLGISQRDLQKLPTEKLLLKAADGFARIEDPAAKSTAATALFGKQGARLLPVLSQGADGIAREQEELERLGVVMGSTEDAKRQIAAQRTFDRAMLGLKITLGTQLLPALTAVFEAFGDFVGVLQPFLRNRTFMKVAIGILAGAWVGYRIAVAGAALAQWGLNAAILASPWFWLIAVLILAGVEFYLLYTKVKWYADYIKAVLPGVVPKLVEHKSYLGAIGVVIDRLIGKSGGLKRSLQSAWSGAQIAITNFRSWLSRVAGTIWDGVKQGFRAVMNWIIGKWNGLKFSVPKVDLGPLGHFGGTTIGVPQIAPLAAGGTIRHAGTVLVGERGPELLTLPAAAQVAPLPAGAIAAAGGADRPIVTQVFLDRRQIAEAVGHYTAGRMARG